MNRSEEVFAVEGLAVRTLDRGQVGLVQRLTERCADYIAIVEGRLPGAEAGNEFFEAHPNDRNVEDVLKLGIFAGEGLVGLLEAVGDYPAPGDWHIGLLMLDPSVRNRGSGTQLYEAFEYWASARGAKRIVLTVVDDNAAARRFWDRRGFVVTRTSPPEQMGDKFQGTVTMERRLGDAPIACGTTAGHCRRGSS